MNIVKNIFVPVFGLLSSLQAFSQNTPWSTTGNIGIGTTSPNRPLAVNGVILSWNSSDIPGYGGLSLGDNGGHYWGFRRTATGSHLVIDAWNGSANVERMRILSNNGYVGIGNNAPQSRLSIGNKVSDDNNFTYDGNSIVLVHQIPTSSTTLNDPKTVLMLARQGTSGQAYGAAAAFNISRFQNNGVNSRTRLDISLSNTSFDVNSNNIMTLLSNGSVGIGTTTPQATLDVNGVAMGTGFISKGIYDNVFATNQSGSIFHLIGSYPGWDNKAIYIAGYNATNATAVGQNVVTEKVFIGNPSFGDKFLSVNLVNGDVGIGTTDTKGYKLAVNGSAVFTKVVVKQYQNWPDYVFHNTYRLRPLSEVEQYIQQHHHLPEVPSAEEVKKEGLDLGDNQATLLKKIEELTLYILDLNKTVEKQQREIQLLTERLNERK